jgi:hypothetical protein
MANANPGDVNTERHPMVATGLGMPRFPGWPSPDPEMKDHIMGVVVNAWLTRHPVARWGDRWAKTGTMRVRYRAHLTAGTPLTVEVSNGDDLGLAVVGADGQLYADGRAGLSVAPALRLEGLRPVRPGQGPSERVAPRPETLDGLELVSLEVDFDADRDLAFVGELEDGGWWRERGWAHPAGLASGANAVLERSIAFLDGGYWKHAGTEAQQLQPIESGSRVLFGGEIVELFDGPHHRFAIAAIQVLADGCPAAVLRVVFVYGPAGSTSDYSPH